MPGFVFGFGLLPSWQSLEPQNVNSVSETVIFCRICISYSQRLFREPLVVLGHLHTSCPSLILRFKMCIPVSFSSQPLCIKFLSDALIQCVVKEPDSVEALVQGHNLSWISHNRDISYHLPLFQILHFFIFQNCVLHLQL